MRSFQHTRSTFKCLWLPCGVLVVLALVACGARGERDTTAKTEKEYRTMREQMVSEQVRRRGIEDERILNALRNVPRHAFVPETQRARSYEDNPLPIGEHQTISQPYIVALMTSLLQTEPSDKILEIGTGSGYQAAVLGELVDEVYTIEIIESLGMRARADLAGQGYDNVHVRIGDGYLGWPEEVPFDGIIVTAAPEKVPRPLIEQLKEGGRMVIPVGEQHDQRLKVLVKRGDAVETIDSIAVRFVPMTGRAQETD